MRHEVYRIVTKERDTGRVISTETWTQIPFEELRAWVSGMNEECDDTGLIYVLESTDDPSVFTEIWMRKHGWAVVQDEASNLIGFYKNDTYISLTIALTYWECRDTWPEGPPTAGFFTPLIKATTIYTKKTGD